jgi:hypothetical protein
MGRVVNHKELFRRIEDEFDITQRQIGTAWRKWPHMQMTGGKDIRTARFDLDEILAMLRNGLKRPQGGNNEEETFSQG